MAQKARNPGAGRRQGFGIGMVHEAASETEYNPLPLIRQEAVDIVGLLASRSGVAAATVRAHLIAFGMEARS